MTKKKLKQSVLVGALTSSFGIFISKALGLLYYSPLSALAGEGNMAFYSIVYTYYDLLLKISSAGIPFAIAALVARYCAKEDYKTALLVKKLGISLIMGLSVTVAFVFFLIATPLARQSMGSQASPEDIANLRNLFYILLVAVIFVPYLSAIRGYYQGLKRLDLYASSQVLEQFVRVGSILFFGYLLVRVFSLENVYAIYTAIAAAGIAAIVALLFVLHGSKAEDRRVSELVALQKDEALARKAVFTELFSLGLPYVLISALGSISPLVNTTYFLDLATSEYVGMTQEYAKLSLGILQANCNKLSSIPQVLSLGFSSGLVPYLTESLERQDFRKLSNQITQLLDTVLYILIPVLFVFVFFAKDIYYIMYGKDNLELGTSLFRMSNILTLTDTIAPILSSIMITLRMRKSTILVLLASCFVKILSFYPCIMLFGAYGMIYSSFLCTSTVIILYLLILRKRFSIGFRETVRRGIMIIGISFIMVVPAYMIHRFLHFSYDSRFYDILIMGGIGILMVVLYYFLSVAMRLPQMIFDIEKPSIKNLLQRFRA